MMKNQLSVLIPTHNDECFDMVLELHKQASSVSGLQFEIIVADDGSDQEKVVEHNSGVARLAHCRFVRREANVGRSAIRNFLAREARYEWLLFLDASLAIPSPQFVRNYVAQSESSTEKGGSPVVDGSPAEVVCGGVTVGKQADGNLRCRYETAAQHRFTAEQRRRHPYQSFRTCNFLIKRTTLLQHPLREDIRSYGYEDVLFGKMLCECGIRIAHIDNPVAYIHFEDNAIYINKVEESMRTLYAHREELGGYSPLLAVNSPTRAVASVAFRLFGKAFRRQLCSRKPSLAVLKLYKLGYFLNISHAI